MNRPWLDTKRASEATPMRIVASTKTALLKLFWGGFVATPWTDPRKLGDALRRGVLTSSAYGDTVFYFGNDVDVDGENKANVVGRRPLDYDEDHAMGRVGRCGYVGLTIDDGLCRGGSDSSMVQEVRDVLHKYGAHATFFVCTDYTTTDAATAQLLMDGHELGNHCSRDVSGYYCNLSSDDFKNEVLEANRCLEEEVLAKAMAKATPSSSCSVGLVGDGSGNCDDPVIGAKIRWFRAPQGRMTSRMRRVLRGVGLTNVLGDCYCDDWAFAEQSDKNRKDNAIGDDAIEDAARTVAELMIGQIKRRRRPGGSIAIFHMPERGFRESSLRALERFLRELQAMGMSCLNLTEMERIYQGGGGCVSPAK